MKVIRKERGEGEMEAKGKKGIWLYLDGERECDLSEWASSINIKLTIEDAKKRMIEYYQNDFEVEFKLE